MALLPAYRERVEGIADTFPSSESRLKRAGVKLFALVAGIETETWRAFPVVDSSVVVWNQDSGEALKQELQEILDESESDR